MTPQCAVLPGMLAARALCLILREMAQIWTTPRWMGRDYRWRLGCQLRTAMPTPRSMGTPPTTPLGGGGTTRARLALSDHPLPGCGGTHYGDCRACGSGKARGGLPASGPCPTLRPATPHAGEGASAARVLGDCPLTGSGGTHYGDCRACGSGRSRGRLPVAGSTWAASWPTTPPLGFGLPDA